MTKRNERIDKVTAIEEILDAMFDAKDASDQHNPFSREFIHNEIIEWQNRYKSLTGNFYRPYKKED